MIKVGKRNVSKTTSVLLFLREMFGNRPSLRFPGHWTPGTLAAEMALGRMWSHSSASQWPLVDGHLVFVTKAHPLWEEWSL